MSTIPVVFSIEHGECSDPDLDDAAPNHYSFAIGAMELPREGSGAPSSTAANAAMLARFDAALRSSNDQAGEMVDFSMFDAAVLNVPGLAPFVAFTVLVESHLSLDERQNWERRHLFSAAEAALGAPVLDLADFFPQDPAERAAAIDAWSSLCMDPYWAPHRAPPPTKPFLIAFSQWEAQALKAALARDRASMELGAAPTPEATPKRAPLSL